MSAFRKFAAPGSLCANWAVGLPTDGLRGGAFVLFASGFAASALEIVLLLAFQVLCGSLYHQVGVIVTVFMLGLALGAWLINRLTHLAETGLVLLAWAIAAYAVLLPLALPLLNRMGGTTASLLAINSCSAATQASRSAEFADTPHCASRIRA